VDYVGNCQQVFSRDEIIEGVWGDRVVSGIMVSSALKSAGRCWGVAGYSKISQRSHQLNPRAGNSD